MIVRTIKDAVVVYQIPIAEEGIASEALLIQRDNGDALIISQEDREIVIDPHRGNVKQIFQAINKVLAAMEAENRKKNR